ncbi:MAG: hypothetical protein ACOYN5_03500 [Bacteroidales bacterium]
MSSSVQLILEKVELYIRKYYLNRLIKGFLLSFFLLVTGFLTVNLLEYFIWLPSGWRMIFFYSYVILFLYVAVFFVFLPVANLIQYRRKMTNSHAAKLIGKYFPEIGDSLLNTLQLNEIAAKTKEAGLLLAAIEQRSKNLSFFRFELAVDLKSTLKLLPYAVGIVIFMIIIFLVSPDFMGNSTRRIIHYNEQFSKPLPFRIEISNPDLSVMQYEDFVLEVKVSGKEIPEKFYVSVRGSKNEMNRLSNGDFSYTFSKVTENILFSITSYEFVSEEFTLVVNPKPVLLSVETELIYPSYLDRSNELLSDINYFSVPVGTEMIFTVFTRDSDGIVVMDDSIVSDLKTGANKWKYAVRVNKNKSIHFEAYNLFLKNSAGLDLLIEVIKDEYPLIQAEFEKERLNSEVFFSGNISDDYGFNLLSFNFKTSESDNSESWKQIVLPIEKNLSRQNFFYSFNMDSLVNEAKSTLEVYFEVTDNDRVTGPKSKRTPEFKIEIESTESLDSLKTDSENKLDQKYDELMRKNELLKKEFNELQKNLLQKNELDWKDRKALENMQQQQKELLNQWEMIKSEQKNLDELSKLHQNEQDRLLEKQAKIEELFEKVIPEELKEMMKEIEKLLQETDKDKMKEALEKLKENSGELDKILDRKLELLNRLQVEKNLNEVIDQLKKLADQTKKMGDSIQKKNSQVSAEDIEKQKDKFNDLQKKLTETDSLNKKLEEPFEIQRNEDLEKSVNEDLNQSEKSLEQKDMKEAGENAKDAGKKMSEMAESLESGLASEMESQNAEDAEQLRKLLENILRTSHDEENLLHELQEIQQNNPEYKQLIQKQARLQESFIIVEDSLLSLAKRQPAIQQFVFDEVKEVQRQFFDFLGNLKERNTGQALENNQSSVMHLNNLALMISEALQDMEEEMNKESSMSGKGKPKPGKGKGESMKSMRELQEALGKQMKQKGGEKSGKDPNSGMTSEEFAKMAAQQEMIRQQLQNYMNELNKEGQTGNNGLNKAIQDMEKMENELVNKRLSREMIDRQNEIVSRLLESEKAERERELEERRESEEFKGNNKSNLQNEIPYNRNMPENKDVLIRFPVEMKPYYKSRSGNYLLNIKK